ncbi:MAG: hypothetical protein LC749_14300 [Actinobacteria bacterium]|nr:hypothetical protein [Actinomycetota bacterium]
MSARAVRLIVIVVCVGGIGGMIGGSIADNNAVVVTFGIITAVASLCLMVATAVTSGAATAHGRPDDARAARVEAMVEALAAEGTNEEQLRELVVEAVRLGRGSPQTP